MLASLSTSSCSVLYTCRSMKKGCSFNGITLVVNLSLATAADTLLSHQSGSADLLSERSPQQQVGEDGPRLPHLHHTCNSSTTCSHQQPWSMVVTMSLYNTTNAEDTNYYTITLVMQKEHNVTKEHKVKLHFKLKLTLIVRIPAKGMVKQQLRPLKRGVPVAANCSDAEPEAGQRSHHVCWDSASPQLDF